MDSTNRDQHLGRIETHWTAVFQAHQGRPHDAEAAQAALIQRYAGAVHRHLLASLRDVDAADDLSQEFALRFFRGTSRTRTPEKGDSAISSSDAIYHLMMDYHRSRKARPHALGDEAAEPDEGSWDQDLDRQFIESCARTVDGTGLDRARPVSGTHRTAVRRRTTAADHEPRLEISELAERLSERLGRPVNAGWVRTQPAPSPRDVRGIPARRGGDFAQEPLAERLEEELSDLRVARALPPGIERRGI